MDERGVPRRGARPALWFSDDAFSMAVGNEWTMDSPTDWVVGEGEDERRSVKVHSTSTESRPVPSHASSQGPPQASPGGIRGEGGQFSSPLPRGCPRRVGGLDFWEVSLAEKPWKDATGRFNTASGALL